ncbi:MAG: universal stress protein [Halobacteriaceae archaeon]
MTVLVPIDGSECSQRALRYATEFVTRFETDLHVIHITDHPKGSDELVDKAKAELESAGLVDDPEVLIDVRGFRWADRVGKDIVELVEREDYEHVILGHHGTGAVGRAILGSTAETVIDGTEVPVTVIH